MQWDLHNAPLLLPYVTKNGKLSIVKVKSSLELIPKLNVEQFQNLLTEKYAHKID